MIIAFSGASGSGKTSLLKHLSKSSILETETVSIKDEDKFVLLNLLKTIVGRQSIQNYQRSKMGGVEISKNSLSLTHIGVGIIYPLIIFLEFLFDYLKYEVVFKKRILLKDRYIYDYLITLENNFGIKNKIWEYLFTSFPRPGLLYYIDITPQSALTRNKNREKAPITNTLNFHKQIIDSYRRLSRAKGLLLISNDKRSDHAERMVDLHLQNKVKFSNLREIVVCGQDGVGKTTLITSFKEYLSKLNISGGIVHFYHDNLLYKVLKKIGYIKKLSDELENKKNLRRNIEVNKKGKSFIWAFLHFADSYVQYLFSQLFVFNKVKIYDRFFYDYDISFSFLRVPNYRWLTKFSPVIKPTVVLIGNPEVSYKRKPENTLEYFQYSNNRYKKMARENNYILIDTYNKKPADVLSEFINKVKNEL